VRVLDLTRALSGPFCTMILGDLGADVVKVEPADHGDMTRSWGPYVDGQSAYFLSTNRSKKSVALDFRHSEGLALVQRMAAASAVLIENFRPGVADEMGLGYEVLREKNPGLVYASVSGFGHSGPGRDWPGFDQIAQGHAGLMALTGIDLPTRVGVAVGDMTAGMWAAIGIMAALRTRERTGKGERIETSLVASLVAMLGVQGQRYLSAGQVPARTGNSNPVIAPYGTYMASDGPLNLAPATDAMWRALCNELGLADLPTDERFATNAARIANRQTLDAMLAERIRLQPRAHWVDRLVAAGIPAGRINDLPEVFEDAQVRHCRMVRMAEHPVLGPIPQLALPLQFDSLDLGPASAPPVLGQDTVEVLQSYGVEEGEIESLLARRVVVQGTAQRKWQAGGVDRVKEES
jgi:crotonobetainyl-CoA:carnitine CoA-transferase CaiB-like acyl-CoA transferase